MAFRLVSGARKAIRTCARGTQQQQRRGFSATGTPFKHYTQETTRSDIYKYGPGLLLLLGLIFVPSKSMDRDQAWKSWLEPDRDTDLEFLGGSPIMSEEEWKARCENPDEWVLAERIGLLRAKRDFDHVNRYKQVPLDHPESNAHSVTNRRVLMTNVEGLNALREREAARAREREAAKAE